MPAFSHKFRYIDDLCILNNPDILMFLQPDTPPDPNSLFWIYPLPLVEIQIEPTLLESNYQDGDYISGHFLDIKI